MKKKLKQDLLFETLKKMGVSVVAYLGIYTIHRGSADQKMIEKVPEKYRNGNILNSEGQNVLEQIDCLFAAKKKLKDEEVLGPNYLENFKKFNEIFPTGSLPSGSRARTPEAQLKKKFLRFFNDYDFSWDTILKATELYVDEFEAKNYDRMRTSGHFIIKTVGVEEFCDLAEYCEKILEGADKQNSTVKHTTRVFT